MTPNMKHKTIIHRFQIGDVEDPVIMISFVLHDWLKSDKGNWCEQHAFDLSYSYQINHEYMGYEVIVWGYLEDKSITEFYLRWPKKNLEHTIC